MKCKQCGSEYGITTRRIFQIEWDSGIEYDIERILNRKKHKSTPEFRVLQMCFFPEAKKNS